MTFLGEVNINLLSENDVETYEEVWFRVDDKIKIGTLCRIAAECANFDLREK